MSIDSNSSKKNWPSVIERVIGIVAGVATIIGLIIVLLNSRAHEPSRPEREFSKSSHTLAEQEQVRIRKPEVPKQDVKSTSPIVPTPSNKPSSAVTPESALLSKEIAVLVVENDNRIDWTLSSKIASLLKKRGVSITSLSLFNNLFLNSGGFVRLFTGSLRKTELVQLSKQFKTGVFGKKTVTYVKNADFTDLITATITLELHVISSRSGVVQLSLSFSQKGAGFSNADANKIAEDRITQELDTQFTSIVNLLGD